ncbi:hypothetical protein QGP82_21145 [Leptothoe sp. LEGE 181152]|nr:hypothetical protein [Leptothoe sp. LEGE 181152]
MVNDYIQTSQVIRVAGVIEAEQPALAILRVVIEGKSKILSVSVDLLR